MTDDFKNYIKNYEKSGKGSEKKKQRDDTRANLLWILFGGFIVSCIFPMKYNPGAFLNNLGT